MLNYNSPAIRYVILFLSVALFAIFLQFTGCEIEKSEEGLTGYVSVSLVDSSGSQLPGAQIKVDGSILADLTPAVITLKVGNHSISVFKPDYLRITQSVDITFHDTTRFAAVTDSAESGILVLNNAPDGTVLLLNCVPRDTTPPGLFSIGEGEYFVSAFLPGFATALPARWNVNLLAGDTATITPVFETVATGARPDSLATLFSLISDSFHHGQSFSLANYRGKVVVVNFFDYNCVNCIAEFPDLQDVYADPEFSGRIQFFSIDSRDTYSQFNQFRTSHPALDIQFPLLWGTMQRLEDHYRVDLNPTTFVIDQTGTIRYYNRGVISNSMLHGWIEGLLGEQN